MKKADWILIAVVLFLAAAIFIMLICGKKDEGNLYAEITLDGRTFATLPLTEEVTLPVFYGGGTNLIVIENGTVCVREADCPTGVCVKTGAISAAGESIVCIPHRLVITLRSANGEDYDVIIQ